MVAQDDGCSKILGQLGEGVVDNYAIDDAFGQRGGGVGLDLFDESRGFIDVGRRWPPASAAQFIEAGIRGDSIRPR